MSAAGEERSIAERYVALINAERYAELGRLFAPDAVFLNPLGERLVGAEAITAFYVAHLTERRPTMRVSTTVRAGDACWAEMEIRDSTGEFVLTSANHFTLDRGGAIDELRVFLRPRANRR